MPLSRLTVFRFCGAQIFAGVGSAVLFALALLSLRFGLFPFWYDGYSSLVYWIMAVSTTLGFFISLLLHNLSHLISEKVLGSKPGSTELFIFGEVSVGDEPTNRGVEWKVALAGPIFSLLLGAGLGAAAFLSEKWALPRPIVGVFFHLSAGNLTLACFNFLPFFPLDGGRVLRAMIWRYRGDFIEANTKAVTGGLLMAMILFFAGWLTIFEGRVLTGSWIVAFGIALGLAARRLRENVALRRVFDGKNAREIMNRGPICVAPSLSLESLAEDFMDKYHHRSFPVTQGKRLVGYVTERELGGIPPEDWKKSKVTEILEKASERNTIRPEASALRAVDLIRREGLSMVLVAEHGELVGIVTPKDIGAVAHQGEGGAKGRSSDTRRKTRKV